MIGRLNPYVSGYYYYKTSCNGGGGGSEGSGGTSGAGGGGLWTDDDGDGDADVYVVNDGSIDQQALQQAAQNIEEGGNGKLDVHILDQEAAGSVPNAATIHAQDLNGMAGESQIGKGGDIAIDPGSTSDVRIITHELMHAVGVEQDNNVNNGDSIMDYSYNGSTLTDYDRALLQKLYGNI